MPHIREIIVFLLLRIKKKEHIFDKCECDIFYNNNMIF